MKCASLFFIFIFSQLALAGEVSISTTTENLFLCNAGLRHMGEGQICLDSLSGLACDPLQAKGSPCTCYAKGAKGDYVSALVGNGREHFEQSLASGQENYATMRPSDQEFSSILSSVHFDLGSEVHGAEYFIQFCYRGPLQAASVGTVDSSLGQYKVRLTLLGKDKGYSGKIADVKLRYWCDLRGVGAATGARGSAELNPGIVEGDLPVTTQSIPFSSEALFQQVNSGLNSNPMEVPRFCVFQLHFKEKNNLVRTFSNRGGQFEGSLGVYKYSAN